MSPTQLTGSTFRGGLLRGAIAGGVALLVVYGVLFLTSDEKTATAAEACSNGTVVPSPAANPGLVSDCETLLAIRDVLLGDTDTTIWHPMGNWNASTAIRSWRGVRVSGTPRRVTRLDLSADGLEGTLPPQLGDLAKLERLHLGANQLTGPIPAELGNLSSLTRLILRDNQLTGSILAELGNLTELEHLQLQDNRLTGSIPPELGDLSDLTWLELDSNSLTGAIPPELGNLADLLVVTLSGNSLTGCVPLPLKDAALHDLGRLRLPDCPPQRTLTTSAGANGSIDPEEGEHRYDEDTSVTVTATPTAGYRIASWGDDCSTASGTTCTLTMDADKTASVTFEALPRHTLTTSAGTNGSIDPAAGEHSYTVGTSVTVTATPDAGYRIASWGDDCTQASGTTCELTMDADKTASVTFEPSTHTLAVTVTGPGGSVTPAGTTTHNSGAEVTLTASWNDATHSFTGWGGDCSGTSSTCVLTIDANKTVTATFAALAADRCSTTTAADCIRAVYKGAPDDYAQVTDIPADLLLTANSDGRYYVKRGQQYTVVTAARLPTGWTRFYLDRTPLGTPPPVSAARLIPPVGTTYTFTVSTDQDAATLITYNLKQARPFVRPRPDGKPEIGDAVVTTVFRVPTFRYNAYDTTGAVATAGSYAFLSDADDTSTAVTTYEALRDGTTTALLMHKSDADGSSRADYYDNVEAGDLLEWRQADDCFIRYLVTEVKPDPTGTIPRKLLAVEWVTYTYSGCTGTIPASSGRRIAWAPPSIQSPQINSPLRHGRWLLIPGLPDDWDTWSLEPLTRTTPPALSQERGDEANAGTSNALASHDPATVRRHPLWRDVGAGLPTGWYVFSAESGSERSGSYGYLERYNNERGYFAVEVGVKYVEVSPRYRGFPGGGDILEAGMLDGVPLLLYYNPTESGGKTAFLFDPSSNLEYGVDAGDSVLYHSPIEHTIAILLTLFRSSPPEN